ncbi:hypothetical protein P886_0445 [Alteromonadaceae bacterium 2753L.S.0a.02]|nr:hypothetical protein P886_0445 [Alteromonadaceae bacterium 2753L.S.0a.02]
MKKKSNLAILLAAVGLAGSGSAMAMTVDFEDLPDLTSVGEFYASDGLHFSNAISLTAGFSLNEFDYPPSSGNVAIGDDLAPMVINFDGLTNDISANFTYASQLSFSAYDLGGSLIGNYLHFNVDNLGTSELISLPFTDVSRLVVAGEWDGSYIMDDFNFSISNVSPVPLPGSFVLFSTALLGFAISMKKRNLQRKS